MSIYHHTIHTCLAKRKKTQTPLSCSSQVWDPSVFGLPVPCVSYCTWLPTIFLDSLVFCSNVHGSRISLLWQIHSMVFVFQDSSLSFQKSVMHIATNRANGTQEHFFKPSQKWSPTFLTEITPTDISA